MISLRARTLTSATTNNTVSDVSSTASPVAFNNEQWQRRQQYQRQLPRQPTLTMNRTSGPKTPCYAAYSQAMAGTVIGIQIHKETFLWCVQIVTGWAFLQGSR
jgi:hypothetical protein